MFCAPRIDADLVVTTQMYAVGRQRMADVVSRVFLIIIYLKRVATSVPRSPPAFVKHHRVNDSEAKLIVSPIANGSPTVPRKCLAEVIANSETAKGQELNVPNKLIAGIKKEDLSLAFHD